jgi:hypothetical protein
MDKESGGLTDSWKQRQEEGQTVRRMNKEPEGWTDSQKDGKRIRMMNKESEVLTVCKMD